MRFESLLDRHEGGELSQLEAAEMLGISERTFRCWRDRYREDGAEGLVDRRLDKPSPGRAPESELARMRALYQEMYGGSNWFWRDRWVVKIAGFVGQTAGLPRERSNTILPPNLKFLIFRPLQIAVINRC